METLSQSRSLDLPRNTIPAHPQSSQVVLEHLELVSWCFLAGSSLGWGSLEGFEGWDPEVPAVAGRLGWAGCGQGGALQLDIYYIHRFWSSPLSMVDKVPCEVAGVHVPGTQGVSSPGCSQGGVRGVVKTHW